MASMINTNLSSLNAQNNLSKSQASLTTSLQRLSTGLRINSAKDDAAGMAISERMSSQITGLNQAARNSNDGISMAQTAEGALSSIGDSLQRIRELAVQSANGSNTDADRASMQEEAAQLLQEIDRVASQTKFNGRTLLDGSLKNQQFQVGANAGETISFSVGSAKTKSLGSSSAAAITTAQNAGNTALKEGAFSLNGIAIGPSMAGADTASTKEAASSAIAKAAAVNAKSAQSGVTATVNATEVGGTSMVGADSSGTVKINNVDITISTSTDTAATRAAVVAAINAKAQQTGVTAEDTGSDKGGVKLTAADGRNIDIEFDGNAGDPTAEATGLAGQKTYSGSITLNSDKAITVSSNLNGAAGTGGIKDAGLTAGTYDAQTAYASTTTTAVGTIKEISAGDFTINGTSIGASLASSDTASLSFTTAAGVDSKTTSGISKAAAINAMSAQTGVTATVNATEVQGTAMSASTDGTDPEAHSGKLLINGVSTVTIATTTTSTVAENRKAAVDAINAISGQTGVIAIDSNDDSKGVVLQAADGRNISIVQDIGGTLKTSDIGIGINVDDDIAAAGAPSNAELEAGTATSTITLSSASEFKIASGTTDNGTTALSLNVGTYGAGRSGQSLDKLDISTADGANKAIVAIDNALKTVNSARSNLGAIQNRFSAVVSNLQSTSENLSASRSRIRDADFAQETANMTRGQILQQAGTAMLAQANSLPNGVLSLLRG